VPGKFIETGRAGAHVPDRYAEIRSELVGFAPGTLALVGAGIPGKIYCHWLKEAGCVALDVGSILDAWIGKPSRSSVLRDRFGVVDGRSVPAHLQLVEQALWQPEPKPSASAKVPRRQLLDARARAKKAERQQSRTSQRLTRVQVRLQRANRKRLKAERQRDDALRELTALQSRRSVRAALAAARLFRGHPR
jgi:hypothetical protein